MLNSKVVVIVGGAGLLGSQFCAAAGSAGAIVVVADRDTERARAVAGDLESKGVMAFSEFIDITDTVCVDALIGRVVSANGRIDAVVNAAYPRNANYGRRLEDVTYADFCENLNLHLGGYFLVCQRFTRQFLSQGSGNIVNLASIYGSVAPRFSIYEGTSMTMPVEYAAIKAAVLHITRYFAQYYKKSGIRANSLSPGGIMDGQPDAFLRKYDGYCGQTGMLKPSDINDALIFLLSDAAKHINGQNLIVDDGFAI